MILNMYRPSLSDSYTTDYLSWPDYISRRCDICGIPLKFAHADNGKLVHTLKGDVQQVRYKYILVQMKNVKIGSNI